MQPLTQIDHKALELKKARRNPCILRLQSCSRPDAICILPVGTKNGHHRDVQAIHPSRWDVERKKEEKKNYASSKKLPTSIKEKGPLGKKSPFTSFKLYQLGCTPH